ncbi:MAG: hypothetical protein DRQ59_10600, partial [Gammaproteobacteria bacterium]
MTDCVVTHVYFSHQINTHLSKGERQSMRWLYFILVQCLLIGIVGAIVFIHKDRVALIKTPPASLAQWYKPENKRQVWLHNM